MAIVGQSLPQPEVGWRRYDNIDNLIEYKGNFTHETVTGAYRNTTSFNPKMSTEGEVHFYFEGESIRILSPNHPTIRTPKASIFIDDIEYEIKCNYINDYTVLSFEKIGLSNGLHKVVIKNFTLNTGTTSAYAPFGLDAIDINIEGKLRLSYNNMIVQNQTTSRNYSLDDKTLIHLPNDSDKNMILFGIKQGKEITLNTPFTKQSYVNDTPVGKVFTQNIESGHTLKTREVEEEYAPIYQWYETNMTSNTTPSPLVASASDQQTGFETYKAFNNLNTASDTWMTNSNIVNGWIQLDLGSSMVFDCVRITSRNGTGYDTHSPKDFEILASNDNNTFTKLGTFNSNTAWKNYEQRAFTFSNTTAYRYYRINVLSNNGGVIIAINNILFGYKREVK